MTPSSSASEAAYIYGVCSQAKFTQGSAYESGVKSVLTSIVNAAMFSSYNNLTVLASSSSSSSSQDIPIYGLFQCRGDLAAADCSNCVAQAVSQLGTICPDFTGGALQLDGCFVRYDDSQFLGGEDNTLVLRKCGPPDEFNSDVLTQRDIVLAYLETSDGVYKMFRTTSSGNLQGGDHSPSGNSEGGDHSPGGNGENKNNNNNNNTSSSNNNNNSNNNNELQKTIAITIGLTAGGGSALTISVSLAIKWSKKEKDSDPDTCKTKGPPTSGGFQIVPVPIFVGGGTKAPRCDAPTIVEVEDCTCHPYMYPNKSHGSLSFVVIGDWGRKGEYNQSQVAAQGCSSISCDSRDRLIAGTFDESSGQVRLGRSHNLQY
ncbi:hypothetical protein K1719_035912 [Acacia pycnantha]|nr:hypothetical protein K1719_035912 [Acacia pycnantha]